jgi:hydrogenase maturation protease
VAVADRSACALIIGIGNLDRGDDAVGRAVAARLRTRIPGSVRVVESDGQATNLLAWFSESDEVILIDAAMSGGAPGTIERFDAHEAPLPAARVSMSSHGFGLAAAIELARTLGQLPRGCVVFAIEGRSFALGDRLSPEVEAAIEEVTALILEMVCEKAG